jgi:hypothetical protein
MTQEPLKWIHTAFAPEPGEPVRERRTAVDAVAEPLGAEAKWLSMRGIEAGGLRGLGIGACSEPLMEAGGIAGSQTGPAPWARKTTIRGPHPEAATPLRRGCPPRSQQDAGSRAHAPPSPLRENQGAAPGNALGTSNSANRTRKSSSRARCFPLVARRRGNAEGASSANVPWGSTEAHQKCLACPKTAFDDARYHPRPHL